MGNGEWGIGHWMEKGKGLIFHSFFLLPSSFFLRLNQL